MVQTERRANRSSEKSGEHCLHCGGLKAARNPTGECDHLYWPDHLTDQAKIANGYRQVQAAIWTKDDFSDEPKGSDSE